MLSSTTHIPDSGTFRKKKPILASSIAGHVILWVSCKVRVFFSLYLPVSNFKTVLFCKVFRLYFVNRSNLFIMRSWHWYIESKNHWLIKQMKKENTIAEFLTRTLYTAIICTCFRIFLSTYLSLLSVKALNELNFLPGNNIFTFISGICVQNF